MRLEISFGIETAKFLTSNRPGFDFKPDLGQFVPCRSTSLRPLPTAVLIAAGLNFPAKNFPEKDRPSRSAAFRSPR
jgi:hypothetical protein